MVDFMTVLGSVLGGDIFQFYADEKGFLSFKNFIEFCKDHNIFPTVCSKSTLNRIFNS